MANEIAVALPPHMVAGGGTQERYVSLASILDSAIQRTYHQLMLMIDMYVNEALIASTTCFTVTRTYRQKVSRVF